MYFPDLHIEERYFGVQAIKIGWLDDGKPYAKAEDPNSKKILEKIVFKLEEIGPSLFTKGFHICPFCGEATSSTQFIIQIDKKTFYDAPDMIIHYMLIHNYLPPKEFIDAVLNS
jgi:hypothetical protein